MRWNILFADDATKQSAKTLTASIHQGSCTGTVIYSNEVGNASSSSSPPVLGQGVYGIEAVANNAQCEQIGQGCTPFTLPLETDTITVTVATQSPVAQCDAALCVDGKCTQAMAASDGGTVDASITPDDGAVTIPAAWWDTGYKRRILLTISNTSNQVLTDFPLLVMLDDTRAPLNLTLADGSDIRFVDSGNTLLRHELELVAQDKITAWVRVPSIAPNSQTQIWVYFDNPSPAALWGSFAQGTWDSARYYAVYHFASVDMNDQTRDSTSTSVDGTRKNAKLNTAGLFGNAFLFDGSGDWIDLRGGGTRGYFKGRSAFTVSFWMYPTSTSSGVILASSINSTPATTSSRVQFNFNSAAKVVFQVTTQDADPITPSIVTSNASPPVNQWTWVTGVVNVATNQMYLYLNGALDATTTTAFSSMAMANTASSWGSLGADDTGASDYYNGKLDEVRYERIESTPEWVSNQYKSMKDTLVTYGTVQAIP